MTGSDDDDLSKDEILDKLREQGSVMFNHGKMITNCPERDELVGCGLYSMPDPETGDPVMVCTGPAIVPEELSNDKKSNALCDCRYNPDRLTEASSDNWM